MIRRAPAAILAAHRFDPGRRDLYVEGDRDRRFLSALSTRRSIGGVRIIEIDTVDITDGGQGGNRERLMRFAQKIRGTDAEIRFFADRDHDPLIGKVLPQDVWFTDGRDLEGYVLSEDCVRKLLVVGFGVEEVYASELLPQVLLLGRELALLRIYSFRNDLRLPFQASSVRRSVSVADGELCLDIDRYVRTLLSNAGLSQASTPDIVSAVSASRNEFAGVDSSLLVHGKDAFDIIGASIDATDVSERIWLTFEREAVPDYPVLTLVVEYLETA